MYIMHIMFPHLKRRKFHQGITKTTEASQIQGLASLRNQEAQPRDTILPKYCRSSGLRTDSH
jgi:hypothetical protein